MKENAPLRLRAPKLRRFVYEQAVYLCHVLLSCLALLSLFRLYILCRIHMEFCIQHLLVCLFLGHLSVALSKTEELFQI